MFSRFAWRIAMDAPELTENFFDHAEWSVGKRSVSPAVGVAALAKAMQRGRPPMENPKGSKTVRYDDEVIDAFKSPGKGGGPE